MEILIFDIQPSNWASIEEQILRNFDTCEEKSD